MKWPLNQHGAFSGPALIVLALAFAVRLAAGLTAPGINIDGILYINQAKAILQGQLAENIACNLGFLPLNSLLIALSYSMLHDWIAAARMVSLLCGWAAILPVYFIARRFFEERICLLLLLLFSLIPVMVNSSVEIIRDPVAWLFFSFALLSFIRHLEGHSRASIAVSGLLFLLAAWARTEIFFLYLTSALVLLAMRRFSSFLALLAPLAFGIIIIAAGFGDQVSGFLRRPLDPGMVSSLFDNYSGLRLQLKTIAASLSDADPLFLRNFLPESANLLWLIALGMIGTHLGEAVFYPYLVLFVLGFWLGPSLQRDWRVRYLLSIFFVSFLLIFFQVVRYWILEYRWLGPLLIAGAIWGGQGLQHLEAVLRDRLHLSERRATAILCSLIVFFGAAKLLMQSDNGQGTFQQIAAVVADDRRTGQGPVHIAGTSRTRDARLLVSFHANLQQPQPTCPQDNPDLSPKEIADPTALAARLLAADASHLLLAAEDVPTDGQPALDQIAIRLGSWWQADTGPIALYRMNRP